MRHATLGIMENKNTTDKRIQARDSATRMLNRLTAGLAFGAVAGVGILGALSAYTIPGTTSTSSGATASTATSSGTTSTSRQAKRRSVSGLAASRPRARQFADGHGAA